MRRVKKEKRNKVLIFSVIILLLVCAGIAISLATTFLLNYASTHTAALIYRLPAFEDCRKTPTQIF